MHVSGWMTPSEEVCVIKRTICTFVVTIQNIAYKLKNMNEMKEPRNNKLSYCLLKYLCLQSVTENIL